MTQRLLLVPYTFVLLNWAAVRGLVWYLRDRRLDGLWSEVGRGAGGRAREGVLHALKP